MSCSQNFLNGVDFKISKQGLRLILYICCFSMASNFCPYIDRTCKSKCERNDHMHREISSGQIRAIQISEVHHGTGGVYCTHTTTPPLHLHAHKLHWSFLCLNRGCSRSCTSSLSLYQSRGNLHWTEFYRVTSVLLSLEHLPMNSCWPSHPQQLKQLLVSCTCVVVYSLHSSSALDAQLGFFPNQLHVLLCSNSTFCTLSCIPDFITECFCSWFQRSSPEITPTQEAIVKIC